MVLGNLLQVALLGKGCNLQLKHAVIQWFHSLYDAEGIKMLHCCRLSLVT